jgi:hypothetical protein
MKKKTKGKPKSVKPKTKHEESMDEVEVDPDMAAELAEEIVESEPTVSDEEALGIDLTSKHQEYKKHALKHDDIFKGKKVIKKEEDEEEEDYFNEKIVIDPGLVVHEEAHDNANYHRLKKLKEEVHKILEHNTDLDFTKNRRKPGPSDFNKYYSIVKNLVDTTVYTKCEIFVELSYYFSDNLYNMFKMLNKKDGAEIVKELRTYMKMNKKLDDVDFL